MAIAIVASMGYVLEDDKLPNVCVCCYFYPKAIRWGLCDVPQNAGTVVRVGAIFLPIEVNQNRAKPFG